MWKISIKDAYFLVKIDGEEGGGEGGGDSN